MGWNTEGHIVNLLLLHYCCNFDTGLWHCLTQWWPHSANRKPFFKVASTAPNDQLTALSRQVCRSETNRSDVVVSTWLYGAFTELLVKMSEVDAASDNIKSPELETIFHWLKWGLLKTFCTQSKAPCTSSSAMATRSNVTAKFSLWITGPRTTSDFNCNTCNTLPKNHPKSH